MCGCLVSIFLGLIFLAWLIGALVGTLFPYVLIVVAIACVVWIVYVVFFIEIGRNDDDEAL